MSKLYLFSHKKFGQIRGAELDGKGWVAGVDICRALRYPETICSQLVREKVNSKNSYLATYQELINLDSVSGWYIPNRIRMVDLAGAYALTGKTTDEARVELTDWLWGDVFPAMKIKIPEVHSAEIIERNTARVAAEQEELKRNHMQVFNHPDFGDVRTIEINGESWFVGKDVAEALGYQNSSRDINRHVDEEDRLNYRNGSFETNRGMTIINESGLYSLILSSKLPQAKAFKRWVTAEVLPSLRKYGAYMIPSEMQKAIEDPDYMKYLMDLIRADKIKKNIVTAESTKQDKGYIEWCRSVVTNMIGQLASFCPNMTYSEVVEETFNKLFISTMFDVHEEQKKFMGKQAQEAVMNGILIEGINFNVSPFYVIYQDQEIRAKYVQVLANTLTKAQARQLDRLLR